MLSSAHFFWYHSLYGEKQMIKIKDQVEMLCKQHGWICTSQVFECLGVSGLLHWQCSEGHAFHSSIHNAKLMLECPVCRQIKAKQKKDEPAKNISKWQIVPVPDRVLKSAPAEPVATLHMEFTSAAKIPDARPEREGIAAGKPPKKSPPLPKRKIAPKTTRTRRSGVLG